MKLRERESKGLLSRKSFLYKIIICILFIILREETSVSTFFYVYIYIKISFASKCLNIRTNNINYKQKDAIFQRVYREMLITLNCCPPPASLSFVLSVSMRKVQYRGHDRRRQLIYQSPGTYGGTVKWLAV